MTDKEVRIGFDRFLKREWVNHALDLYMSSSEENVNYQFLKDYIHYEVKGIESARKTSNQLKRLWLNEQDQWEGLRRQARNILFSVPVVDKTIFHFGMAINVFPIFKQTCKTIGEMLQTQTKISRNTVIERVSGTYLNPSSIPRIVSRVIQTLEDWQLVIIKDGLINTRDISIEEVNANWFILALILSSNQQQLSLPYLKDMPEKLGYDIRNLRVIVRDSVEFIVQRDNFGNEVIKLTTSNGNLG